MSLKFRFSYGALGVLAIGVALTVVPAGKAAVTIAGFVVIWAGLIGFMRQAGTTMKFWATLMVAVGVWFGLASASGALASWTPRATASAAAPAAPAKAEVVGADLKADVRFTGSEFRIANKGQQPWQDISISVNGAPTTEGYALHVDRVAAGRTLSVSPSRLVGPNGSALDTNKTKPRSLSLSARLGDAGPRGELDVSW